jgi:mannose-6-phosphate isomerase-like protein (cupin superfamily)
VTRALFDRLLAEARAAHAAYPALAGFARFPDDLRPQKVIPHHIRPSALMQADTGLFTSRLAPLRDALIAAAPHAQWRETYKHTDIGQDFLDRFGCYCLIGKGGAFDSRKMWSYVVYMPAGLHYRWHHHPAEELYMVIAGEAEFLREGEAPEFLREGGTSFHASNQPHAMQTHDHPVMALVLWRGGFETAPVLTPPGGAA